MKSILAFLLLGLIAAPLPAQTAEQVRVWLAQMRDKNPSTRATASREIAQLGPKSKKAVPVTTAHVATGALLLATALTFTLCSLKAGRSARDSARNKSLMPREAVA